MASANAPVYFATAPGAPELAGAYLTGAPLFRCEGRLRAARTAVLTDGAGAALATLVQNAGIAMEFYLEGMPTETELTLPGDSAVSCAPPPMEGLAASARWTWSSPPTISVESVTVGYAIGGQWQPGEPPIAELDTHQSIAQVYKFVPARLIRPR